MSFGLASILTAAGQGVAQKISLCADRAGGPRRQVNTRVEIGGLIRQEHVCSA